MNDHRSAIDILIGNLEAWIADTERDISQLQGKLGALQCAKAQACTLRDRENAQTKT